MTDLFRNDNTVGYDIDELASLNNEWQAIVTAEKLVEDSDEYHARASHFADQVGRREQLTAGELLGDARQSIQRELLRVIGDQTIVVEGDHERVTVGLLLDGAGQHFGHWTDPVAVGMVLRDLPDWDGQTVDWAKIGIPWFDG